jgi:3-hydroxy acid dehydrogenase / malonic semialdehyde reductase
VSNDPGLRQADLAAEKHPDHSSKACQEAFTNVLRTELQGTNIKVVALRPGVVATNFHEQRVSYDKNQYDSFMDGFEPLLADDVAENCVWMLKQGERLSVTALNVTPTAQRTLQVIDKTWNERNGVKRHEMGDQIGKESRSTS